MAVVTWSLVVHGEPERGLAIQETNDGVFMDQPMYCMQTEEVKHEPRADDGLTREEMAQVRGTVAAFQWRAYSTAAQLIANFGSPRLPRPKSECSSR